MPSSTVCKPARSTRTGPPATPGVARAYDFNSQVSQARGRMPTLERINERFGQLFRKSCSTCCAVRRTWRWHRC